MSNRNIIIITLAFFLIIFLIGSRFYERKEINTCKWHSSYSYESKIPYGAWLFSEMINQKFGEENVLKNYRDTLIQEIDTNGYLYILLTNNYRSVTDQNIIKDFAKKGNEILVISNSTFPGLTEVYSHVKPKTDDLGNEIESLQDTVFNFSFQDEDSSFTYKNYKGSLEETYFFHPQSVDVSGRNDFTSIGMATDTTSFFYRKTQSDFTVYFHTAPFLFSNIASKQDFYFTHFNKVFNNFENQKVIIDSPYYYNPSDRDFNNNSPIQYILGEESLRWAYLTFLFTTFSFLFFRGKRKQRIIPVLEKNENTSVQYVDTLSELFRQQDQNEKLVPHLEDIFYQRIKQKYYLGPENENFVNLLSRKSRIPEKNISAILNNFKTGGSGYHFSDDQLIMLHRRLEEFYKNAE